MTTSILRIGINVGGGYVAGINAVAAGAVLAANELNWEVVGIRDGFDGLLFPDRYPDGGVVKLTREVIEDLADAACAVLGSGTRSDPFHVRTINEENQVEEVDRSDALLQTLRDRKIDALISVVGSRALGVLLKLSRKGLKTVAVPKSVENDMAATALSFGFNSALSFATEILGRARQAARDARKIGVVEVLGEHAGWLALQAGMAVCADAVLIPEIPYDLNKVAARLRANLKLGRNFALVVVAEGATPVNDHTATATSLPPDPVKAALSPGATDPDSAHVIERSGHVSETVARNLQRLTDHETYPLVIGQLIKGGAPTAVDRQLGLGYGAGAVRALNNHQSGGMVVFQPPDLKFVPFAEVVNKVRRVPASSEFVQIARSLGVSLGD